MEYALSALIGLLLGSLSPAALIAWIKKKNLRSGGTKNLGATNVMLHFGKALGALVMILDIAKAFVAVRLSAHLFPQVPWVGLLAGVAAILGHVFPFYLGFKGGKGLAAFAGVVLAYNPLLFLFLLITGVMLMILVDYSFILPFYAALVFPIYAAVTSHSLPATLLCATSSIIIIATHASNIKKAREKKDYRVSEVLHRVIFKKKP